MAATVSVNKYQRAVIADGVIASVADGHLLVSDAGGAVVAIYAPGHWTSVSLTEVEEIALEEPISVY
ncbi:hypothetical protein [Crossiella cryophila]|uniref:Uncharacterized protein n=1 Tax=Crossiella cryophila TaxID=43355 RepID=A0A7W7CJH4_9PSEU|nr:hypothetical protein [Crossiella cryophila]MBB4682305.1 hypothetical protein [Crossiella cryophila]